MAYHQCRWNYNDQDDVARVNAGFDEHDIPMDVIWLDIEHTDGKRYFTWDGDKFSHSIEMVQNVSAAGRKMVTIVDPHIKKDDNYKIHKECTAAGHYIKNKDGNDYEGWCWPGKLSVRTFCNGCSCAFTYTNLGQQITKSTSFYESYFLKICTANNNDINNNNNDNNNNNNDDNDNNYNNNNINNNNDIIIIFIIIIFSDVIDMRFYRFD